jgi:hypothetical protein
MNMVGVAFLRDFPLAGLQLSQTCELSQTLRKYRVSVRLPSQ